MLPVTVQFLVAMLAYGLNERMARKAEYLGEENRVLKEALRAATGKSRIPLTDEQRRSLARRLGAVHLDDPAAGESSHPEGEVEAERPGGDDRYLTLRRRVADSRISQLQYAKADAIGMYRLVSGAFGGESASQLTCLVDADATKTAIVRAIGEDLFRARLTAEETSRALARSDPGQPPGVVRR